MFWYFLSIYFCLVNLTRAQNEEVVARLVNTDQGQVRGYRASGQGFYSFYNIPYGTVAERFQVAQPGPTWTEPFDAVNRRIVCPQRPAFFLDLSNTTMQEDCLVINIFVPNTNQTNLPVVVDIPGGAFYSGFGDAYQYTDFVTTKNVIMVTFNYRVGLLGFLCLGTNNIPGNVGMKDQVSALRWVNRNIASFGGNPEDVTITGCSAGGASADLLMLSKAANGLFNKVIPDSGASLNTYALLLDPVENAKGLARDLNFTDVDNIPALEEFFMNAPYEIFNQRVSASRTDSLLDYALCVERDLGQEIFLEDTPYNILKSGNYTKYPTLFGLTDKEGAMLLGSFMNWSVMMNEKFSDFLPGDLHFDSDQQREEVAQIIKEFYFGNRPVNVETMSSFIDYQSDVMFSYAILRSIRLHAEAGHESVFVYEYSFEDTPSIIAGASHCAQARAARDEDESNLSEDYRRIKAVIRDIWYNFITTGNPGVTGSPASSWPPVGLDRTPYMSVGRTLELRGPLEPWRARFWDIIYERFYRSPAPPSIPPTTDAASPLLVRVWLIIFSVIFCSISNVLCMMSRL